ncbi:hypothetical protein P280DRAFT_477941 [Massarina eburnea CBS 473.64]|uniref:Uncharacterized protein n=1 Tax=Massarina eburnea CBS 473.64 TaxID=1395130 RepID=A0A6A6S5D8_9PLEO|nr:hypothetical protein P280DRAFT_477941 [Massarina eburnea CBS 473.64]
MSLVAKVGQAGPLKPEIRLAQAVSHFESCLPSDRKPEFRNLKIQTLQSPPGPKDVMRLTGEMDPSRKAGSRCFGPRFTNFLHGVQRFAALGDIIIGGSQNLVACGVWSVVRTSLLSVVNFSSYIEQLSQLIMEVGRTAPLHEKMALLYPKSERLQSHLSEYFIVVVSLCHHTMMFSQRSSFRKLSSAFSDPDLKKFQSELCAWSNSIKNEIQALMAERIEVEAQKSSLFRLNLDKISKRRFHKKRIELQYRLLDLCSTYDHETTWKQIRKIGNTTCFLNDEYETWKKAQDHEIHALVYHGKLGCGKSVMLANIIQDLASQANKNSTVAYFFCRNDVSESLKARTIIGSLVRQLLRHFLAQSQDTEDVSSLQGFEHAIVMDYEEMYRLVERCKSSGQQSYIVVDGLDLCDHAEWKKFLTNMQGMQDRLASHVCIALRSAPNDKLLDVRHGPYFRIITNNNLVQNAYVSQAPKIRSMPNNKEDIESYIEAELEYRLRNRQLIIGDPTLILDIQDVLSNSADGMFLWVALQLEFLCDMQTDQEIRNALTELPKDLSDTYMRILRKRQPSGSIYQRRIFELVVVAVRPLTLDEMRVALSVTPGDTNWSTSRLLNDVLATLACCGCLLAVDEEDHTVRLVHSSVETFLLDGYQDLNSETIRLSSAHGQMSGILVTYLRYDIFNTEVSQVRIPEMNVESIPSKIEAQFRHQQDDSESDGFQSSLSRVSSSLLRQVPLCTTLMERSLGNGTLRSSGFIIFKKIG